MSADDSRWTEYALGLLDPEMRRELERELDRSAVARRELSKVMEGLEATALASPEVAPSPRLRETILASLGPATRFEGLRERLSTFLDLSAKSTRELVAEIAHVARRDGPWEDDQVPGLRLLHFDGGVRVAEAHCGLVHIEPGTLYPPHRHRGDEWAFILQGCAEEDSGAVWRPGDLVHQPAGSTHAFRVVGNEPFVFAVVLYEGLDMV